MKYKLISKSTGTLRFDIVNNGIKSITDINTDESIMTDELSDRINRLEELGMISIIQVPDPIEPPESPKKRKSKSVDNSDDESETTN